MCIFKQNNLFCYKVSPVERFLEKPNNGRSRSSSRGSSPGRSPVRYDSSGRNMLIDEHVQGFRVNIKPEKKSKLSSVVLKIRGIDQVTCVILFLLVRLYCYYIVYLLLVYLVVSLLYVPIGSLLKGLSLDDKPWYIGYSEFLVLANYHLSFMLRFLE